MSKSYLSPVFQGKMNVIRKIRMFKNPEVLPLVGILTFAAGFGVFMLSRAALRYPDVAWDHKHNPSPYLDIKADEQRKLYSHTDYSKLKDEKPKF